MRSNQLSYAPIFKPNYTRSSPLWQDFAHKNFNTSGTINPMKLRRRPWIIILLVITFLLFATQGFQRIYGALADWELLQSVGLRPGPAYLALTGAVYGLSGLAVALALWFGWRKAGRLGRGMVIFYFAWFWIDKMLISQNPASKINWPFAAIVSLLTLGLVLGGLWLGPVRQYLRELDQDTEVVMGESQ